MTTAARRVWTMVDVLFPRIFVVLWTFVDNFRRRDHSGWPRPSGPSSFSSCPSSACSCISSPGPLTWKPGRATPVPVIEATCLPPRGLFGTYSHRRRGEEGIVKYVGISKLAPGVHNARQALEVFRRRACRPEPRPHGRGRTARHPSTSWDRRSRHHGVGNVCALLRGDHRHPCGPCR